MDNKIFDNLRNKNITESSLKLYYNNLRRLNDNKDIKNLNFLKNIDAITDKIKDYKSNTRRSYIISIVSLLKEEPKMKNLYTKYYDILMNYNKELQSNNSKSEKQSENWISQDEILEIYVKLKDSIMPKLDKKKLNEQDYNILLSFVVLSLYVLEPPRRNLDYQYMMIIKHFDANSIDAENNENNYLDITNWTFYFQRYKTQGTYKTQSLEINDELKEVIKKYLKFHPLKSEFKKKSFSVPFLVNYQGEQLLNNNSITRILNKIFGKRIGVSMLRNIYLTSKYSNNLKDLQSDCLAMGTSSNTAENNYIKLEPKN